MKKIALLFAATLALSGCGAIGGVLKNPAQTLAERQCAKSETRRLAERLASYYATGEVAAIKVLCEGDKELEETRAAAEAAKCVFDNATGRDYVGASQCLAQLIAEVGVSAESVWDVNGCITTGDFTICPNK